MVKEVESRVLAETDIIESDEKVTALIQTHNALATALEIKNALHTIILQMDETLAWKLDQQKKMANLKGMLVKLRNRFDDHIDDHIEDYVDAEEVFSPQNLQPGTPLKKHLSE